MYPSTTTLTSSKDLSVAAVLDFGKEYVALNGCAQRAKSPRTLSYHIKKSSTAYSHIIDYSSHISSLLLPATCSLNARYHRATFALAVRLTRVYQHRRRTVRRNRGGDETLSRVHFFTANNSFGLFLFWTSHVLFFCSTRFKVSRMLMFRAREVGLLATASQSKQALVPKVYLPRGETGNVYSSSSDGIYLVCRRRRTTFATISLW